MGTKPKYLTDPDEWYLPETVGKDVIWVEEDALKELWGDIIYDLAKKLGEEVRRKLNREN